MALSAPAFWSRPGHPAGAILSPLGTGYAAVVRARLARAAPYRADVPVLCAGNATLGGVGKTPWTIMLAKRLIAQGRAPHLLTRGYGGTAKGPLRVSGHGADEVGDEALLLAAAAPTWVGADRAASARAAVAAGADVLLMDDGFQNTGLAKDLSFLLIDAEAPFGNARVFPAGPLRERPRDAARRAHAVVSVGQQDHMVPDAVLRLAQGKPLLRAWLTLDVTALDDRPVHAVAGIGRPERFFEALARTYHAPAARHAFPDHHTFTDADLAPIAAEADAAGARLVTTAKDHVRLPPAYRARLTPVRAGMNTDEAALDAVLEAL